MFQSGNGAEIKERSRSKSICYTSPYALMERSVRQSSTHCMQVVYWYTMMNFYIFWTINLFLLHRVWITVTVYLLNTISVVSRADFKCKCLGIKDDTRVGIVQGVYFRLGVSSLNHLHVQYKMYWIFAWNLRLFPPEHDCLFIQQSKMWKCNKL